MTLNQIFFDHNFFLNIIINYFQIISDNIMFLLITLDDSCFKFLQLIVKKVKDNLNVMPAMLGFVDPQLHVGSQFF